jgi:hypothetical protein
MNEKEKFETTQKLACKCKTCELKDCMKCPAEEFNKLFGLQIQRFRNRKPKTLHVMEIIHN